MSELNASGSRQEAIAKVGTLIKDVRIAMSARVDENGRPHSRKLQIDERKAS